MSSLVSPSSVSFPSTDPTQPSIPYPHLRPPHQPFRRISLPSATSSNLYRQSIASMASFDSLPEEGSSSASVLPAVSKAKRSSSRPSSFEMSRKSNRPRPHNDAKEAKRRRVINEFYETEQSYVDGLELIYSHFLTPIIASLDTPHQLLDRTELTSVFSNFIDIWNLHRSFFSSLSMHLQTLSSTSIHELPPSLSPILLSHFPYLSLYSPFITSFHAALSSYASLLSSKPEFASFIGRQEADPRCGKLKLRDWLLTVVQRCPRYLLLLKDLIGCTDPGDPEHVQLTSVHALVSKITLSLNTSLHTHAQTLSLLAIQRSTPNLPFQLISPGRSFLKRGPMLQVEGNTPRQREFFLFSDCVMWLSSGDKCTGELLADRWAPGSSPSRPPLIRTRSKSDAEVSKLQERDVSFFWPKSKSNMYPISIKKKQRHASSDTEEKWQYRGHIELVDLEVVVSPPLEPGEESRFEILSPQISFATYAESEEERDGWVEAIRSAKASLFVSLNATKPNSTLTSSSSTNHLRRTLQALPHLPEEVDSKPKRGKVEHFVPAIWIPDGKTENCMRCGRSFGWRRRRHHCRLCGRCVCSSCSGKTFFISESTKDGESHKPARACDACYETVFPLMDAASVSEPGMLTQSSTITTLSGFPSWKSVRVNASNPPESSLPSSASSMLMTIDLESPKRELTRIEDDEHHGQDSTVGASSRIRIKPTSRPRSYHQILEDFAENSPTGSRFSNTDKLSGSVTSGDIFGSLSASFDAVESTDEIDSSSTAGPPQQSRATATPPPPSRFNRSPPSSKRREDTARRQKRFSVPALALQTTSVTTRPNVVGDGNSRRFSLVSGSKGGSGWSASPSQLHLSGRPAADDSDESGGGYGHGAAASKLNELLKKVQKD